MQLLQNYTSHINGTWRDTDSYFDVTNPANGTTIKKVANSGSKETYEAIDAAHIAFGSWRNLLAKERSKILRAWYHLIIEHQSDLAKIMTQECGKPLAESMGEVLYGASFVEFYAEEAKRIYGETIPQHGIDKRVIVTKEPIGVCAAITPWNFPLAMITRKIAPALAAGCTVIVKPAEDTPLTAIALMELAVEAGFPKGVINLILASNGVEIGEVLCESNIVRKISFTGSTEVGRILMRNSAQSVKKLSLELGGNAPFIVFDDADIDAAVAGAMICKFRNTGQTCVCANRIYVQDAVYDQFLQKFKEKIETLRVGNGLEEGVTQGPLINQDGLNKVAKHVKDAVDKGAKIVTGGKVMSGNFFEPTLLSDVSLNAHTSQEETFGPVAPVYRFSDEKEVIQLANDTEFGLAAYFYSREIGRIWRVAEALEYGMVGINEGIISSELVPFGGVKHSGLGREGSKHGIEEYCEIKYLCLGGLSSS